MKLNFDSRIFSKEAILATSYWCADRLVSDVSISENNIDVELLKIAGEEISEKDMNDFKSMVVHNQIRHQLSQQFAQLETAIVEKAFAPIRN